MSSRRARGSLLVLMGTVLGMAVLALLVVTGPDSREATGPTRIMVVGDSVSQGSAGDYTWRYRLWRHLLTTGADVDFVGPRDDLFDNVSETLGSHDYVDTAFDQDHAARWGNTLARARTLIAAQVRAYRPDVVLVLLGTNDLAAQRDSPEEAEALLRDLVRRARLASGDLRLVIAKLPDAALPGATEFNERVEDVAADLSTPESPIAVASTDVGFTERADTWDPFHPNARGELKIAAAMADALSALGVGWRYPRPLPEVPLGPRVAPALVATPADGEAALSWSATPGATGYYVWLRDLTVDEPWSRLPFPVEGTAWRAVGLENRHQYAFRLQPEKGWWASVDVRSNTALVTPLPASPGPVTNVTAVPDGSGGAALSWTPAEGATGYYVWQRDASAQGPWARLPGPLAQTSFTVDGLVGGPAFEYAVQPSNDGVDGPLSASVSVLVGAAAG